MKKILLGLISFLTLSLSTSAEAMTTIYYSTDFNAYPVFWSPLVYPATVVSTHTDFWGTTVTVYQKDPKQIILENGIAVCVVSAALGIKGIADICQGLGSIIKESGNNGLLPLGLLEVSGATLFGACGYLALKSLQNQAQ